MDFVVVGLGVGALAVLLGLTIREVGSRWWSLNPDLPLSSPDQARSLAIGRVSRAGGTVLSLAGALILLATIVAIALGLPDRTGAIVVMAVVTIAVLGTVAWGGVYAFRHHPPSARPTRRPRPTAELMPDQRPSLAGTIDAAFASDDDTQTGEDLPKANQDIAATSPEPPAEVPDTADTPDAVAASTSAGATGATGLQASTTSLDLAETPDTGEAPAALANDLAEAASAKPPATGAANTADPTPERPAQPASPARQSQWPISGESGASGAVGEAPDAPATVSNPDASPERAPTLNAGDGQPTPTVPAPTANLGPRDEAQDSNGAASNAPVDPGAGTGRPAPGGGATGPRLADSTRPRTEQPGPGRSERST